MREREAYVFKEGTPLAGPMTESEALTWLLRNQRRSVDYALRFCGYKIKIIGEFGGVCVTLGCTGMATQMVDRERDHGMYRCVTCEMMIRDAIPPFDEDSALSREDHDALIETVLAMTREALTAVKDTFAP
jgi:hypothetical protein